MGCIALRYSLDTFPSLCVLPPNFPLYLLPPPPPHPPSRPPCSPASCRRTATVGQNQEESEHALRTSATVCPCTHPQTSLPQSPEDLGQEAAPELTRKWPPSVLPRRCSACSIVPLLSVCSLVCCTSPVPLLYPSCRCRLRRRVLLSPFLSLSCTPPRCTWQCAVRLPVFPSSRCTWATISSTPTEEQIHELFGKAGELRVIISWTKHHDACNSVCNVRSSPTHAGLATSRGV